MVVAGTSSCGEDFTEPASVLDLPTDFVASGPGLPDGEPEYLFVANSGLDVITAFELDHPVDRLTYVPGPLVYWPLMLPVGPQPTAMATSSDGLIVLVASGIDGSIVCVDTQTLSVVAAEEESQEPWRIPLGAEGAQLTQLVAGAACGPTCQRFWVLDARGAAIELELFHTVDQDGGLAHVDYSIGRIFELMPTPSRMVIDKEHNQLWVSQGSRTHLQRIDLASGRITAVDLGEPQSDLALWPDSSLLAVTLPASRSIAVLDEPAGTPRRIDNMPRYLPPDAASDEADVFMGDIPHRLFAAGAQVEHPELTVRCTSSDDSRTDTFSRYIIAASLRGSMRFLVPASGGSSLTLADSKACVSPSVDSDSDLGQWFLPCEGRPRPHSCIPGSGIAVYPGYTAASTWEVRWQGDLTAQQGAEGDGVIDESGRLDLSASSFQPGEVDIRTRDEDESGDILIILQAPLASPSSCREIYGDEDQLSKRSFQITSRSGDIIELDEPLDQNCFPAIGEDVSFAIRARDSFVVYRSYEIDEEIRLEYQGRVSPGERFFSGSSNDPSSFLSFTIDPTVCGGSCANDEGVVFDVEAPFAPVIAGGNNAGTVGRLPSRLAFVPVERGAQMPLAVLYSASNLLFLQLSLDSSSIFDADMIHNYD